MLISGRKFNHKNPNTHNFQEKMHIIFADFCVFALLPFFLRYSNMSKNAVSYLLLLNFNPEWLTIGKGVNF